MTFSLGDELLEGVLQNQESLNMGIVYDVIDWYKRAVILTRDIEVLLHLYSSHYTRQWSTATEFSPIYIWSQM